MTALRSWWSIRCGAWRNFFKRGVNPKRFRELAAQGYNCIPLSREVAADLDTPLSVYFKLGAGKRSYLLESVLGGEKWGRYSIIGLPARATIRVTGDTVTLHRDGEIVEQERTLDPLAWIDSFLKRRRTPAVAGLPRFCGGLVGYFGYDTIRYIEPRLRACDKPPDYPDVCLLVSDEVAIFDNLAGRLRIVVHADPGEADAYERARARLQAIEARLSSPVPETAIPRSRDGGEFVSCFARADFEAAVERIKRYVVEGDVMQVVLSQRLSVPFDVPPIQLYRALRTLDPSPYLYFLNLDELQIVGSSPEVMVRLERGQATLRPIAGTRPRGSDEAEDLHMEQALLADPKERAEHLMLIDLGRNDVGRVARAGSVRVTERMSIERYAHVMHIVSNVQGQLTRDKRAIDVLRATFPAGTVSGAPKIRAMEIIDELEPVRRGIYAGAVGYLSWSGNMDLAIAIRTAVLRNRVLFVQVGAGIVADSQPQREWQETMDKGRALFRAAELAREARLLPVEDPAGRPGAGNDLY